MPREHHENVSHFSPPAATSLVSTLEKRRSDIEEIIETIYDNISQDRPDLSTSIPEMRSKVLRLLAVQMDSINALAATQILHGPAFASAVRILQQHGDDLVDSVNVMIRQSNTVLMDIHWFEEDTADTAETPAAQMKDRLSQNSSDLKVKCIKNESTDTADYSPLENAGNREILGSQPADCPPSEIAEKRTGTREILGSQPADCTPSEITEKREILASPPADCPRTGIREILASQPADCPPSEIVGLTYSLQKKMNSVAFFVVE